MESPDSPDEPELGPANRPIRGIIPIQYFTAAIITSTVLTGLYIGIKVELRTIYKTWTFQNCNLLICLILTIIVKITSTLIFITFVLNFDVYLLFTSLLIGFCLTGPNIFLIFTWFHGNLNFIAISVLVMQILTFGLVPLGLVIFEGLYPITGVCNDLSGNYTSITDHCLSFNQMIVESKPYLAILIYQAMLIGPMILAMIFNEILFVRSGKYLNQFQVPVTSVAETENSIPSAHNDSIYVKILKITSLICLILAGIFGLLAVGFMKFNFKMILFALLMPPINFCLTAAIIYILALSLFDEGDLRNHSSPFENHISLQFDTVENQENSQPVTKVITAEAKLHQKKQYLSIIFSCGLLSAMHNPRLVQAILELSFKDEPNILQESYLLPFFTVLAEFFWAFVYKISTNLYQKWARPQMASLNETRQDDIAS